MAPPKSDRHTAATSELPPREAGSLDDTMPAGGVDTIDEAPKLEGGDRYRVGVELGRGGMGRVVEAFDTQLGRAVALKEVLPKGGAAIVRRFKREVQITARLEHASIVPLYDAGTTGDGRPFYVMRRVTGRPLDQLIASAYELPDRLALLPNMLAAVDAVAHAHRRGVIHRDLKPANILVGELGETVVIDWGLAKVIGEDEDSGEHEAKIPKASDSLQTQIGSVFGTPGFMPPEQARGDDLGPRSDVYALGATLYQLLAGRPPIAGRTATEVIDATHAHDIEPIANLVPGAPPELVAIVDKALAFDPAARYANAGALGEDVRRFLTGQLVAAHSYTRRQRLARFARRHRAALSVASLAMATVAVLAWFSVHRIVQERDAATQARAKTEQQRAEVVSAYAQLMDRTDQLTVMRARGLAETNPTHAIAVLKDLRGDSPYKAEAVAVAKHAIVRGVAQTVPSLPDLTVSFEMSPDGSRIVQLDRKGNLQIIDVAAVQSVKQQKLPPATRVKWVDDGRLLFVMTEGASPALLDWSTGAQVAIPLPPVRDAEPTERGELVVYQTYDRALGIFDVATRTTKQLWPSGVTGYVAVERTGAWIAFEEGIERKHARLHVVARDGRELFVRDAADVGVMAASEGGLLAVAVDTKLLVGRPGDPSARWQDVEIEGRPANLLMWLTFRGETLQIFVGNELYLWRETGRAWRGTDFADTVFMGREVGDRYLVSSTNDGHLWVTRDDIRVSLQLPSVPNAIPRITARRGVSRFAATGRDAVFIYDVDAIAPRIVDEVGNFTFVDDHLAFVGAGFSSEMFFLDLDTGKRQQISSPVTGVIGAMSTVPEERRVMVFLGFNNGSPRAVILRPDRAPLLLPPTQGFLAQLIEGDAQVFSESKGVVMGQIAAEPPRELVKLEGDVVSLVGAGKQRYAALASSGELVRSRFDGNDFARARIEPDASAFLASDTNGRILIATKDKLLAWDSDLYEVSTFPSAVRAMYTTNVGILIVLADKQQFFVGTAQGAKPVRIPVTSSIEPLTSFDGKLFGVTLGMTVEITELATATPDAIGRWTLPKAYATSSILSASPSGHIVAQRMLGRYALWRLPQVTGELQDWLALVTNGVESRDGLLMWTWQNPPRRDPSVSIDTKQ